MKIFFMIAAVALTSVRANANSSISCSTNRGASFALTLDARYLFIEGANEASLRDVTVTLTTNGAVETGRAQILDADTGYNPRRYRNHLRFDMSKLVDASNFGQYLPGDTCSIKVMIPNTALNVHEFEAPAIVNCDQSGGSVTMNCSFTTVIRPM